MAFQPWRISAHSQIGREIVASEIVPAFARFIDELRLLWAREADTPVRMQRARPVLERLLADEELATLSKEWPWTVGQNLLLYEDPDFGFVINATVRPPNSRGLVHDHAHAWTLYGILDGAEQLERYERLDDAATPGHAELRLASDTMIVRGAIDFVAPYEIHAERGGPGRSVALIPRSAHMVGHAL
jgi:predicted metal-dependent enzyme (double-stranded beta helix superfamily)